MLIAYQIYRGPNNRYGKIPGVLGRSEFGLEIIVEIAHLVYIVGLSFDKVCLVLSFFQNLKLGEIAGRCAAAISCRGIGTKNSRSFAPCWPTRWWCMPTRRVGVINNVWAFLSEKARVLFFGVHKDADTLKADSRSGHLCRDRHQRRCGGVCQLQPEPKVLGPSAP